LKLFTQASPFKPHHDARNAGARCDRKRGIKNLQAGLADLADLAEMAEMADFEKGIPHTYPIHTSYIPHT
jgi:hypothetical protein